MALRLERMISGWGRSAGAVIPTLGSGRYSPGPNIVWPSWRKGSDPHFTLTVFWGQPGALATVSKMLDQWARKNVQLLTKITRCPRDKHNTGALSTDVIPQCEIPQCDEGHICYSS